MRRTWILRACIAALTTVALTGALGVAGAPATARERSSTTVSAKSLLVELRVAKETGRSTYRRAAFGVDPATDRCSLRERVLTRDSVGSTSSGAGCASSGPWRSLYEAKTLRTSNDLRIVRLVPLTEAWRSGAARWTALRRDAFRRDVDYRWQLQAASPAAAAKKHVGDPASWVPDLKRCSYVAAWIAEKVRWSLSVDPREMTALRRQIARCGDVRVARPGSPDLRRLVGASNATRSVPSSSSASSSSTSSSSTSSSSTSSSSTSFTNPTATPQRCPVGGLYGEIISVVATPTAVGDTSYVNLSISGYVVNDSDEAVVYSSLAPKIVLYARSGTATSYVFPSWAVPGAAADDASTTSLQAGAVARWELTNYLMPAARWSDVGALSASPISPFSARWQTNDSFRSCSSPLQHASTVPLYSAPS